MSVSAHSNKAKILVVDDEESLLRILSRSLGETYEVRVARDGDQALRLLDGSEGVFQAVLMDLTMPGMDGSTLLKGIRAAQPGIQVGLLTGLTQDAAEPLLRGQRPDAYLRKPVRLQSILDVVSRLVEAAPRV